MSEPTLGSYAEIIDCAHKTAPAAESDVYAYSIGTRDIKAGRLILDNAKPVTRETFDAWTQRAVPEPGDLMLAREAPVGQVGMVKRGAAVCLGQRTVLIKCNEGLDSAYLLYRLLGPELQQWMEDHSEGSTVKHINVADVRKMPLRDLPPLAVQRAVAEVLGAFDDLIDTNRRLSSDLRELSRLSFANLTDYVERPFSEVARLAVRRAKVSDVDPSSRFLGLDSFGTEGRGIQSVGDMTGLTGTQVRFEAGDLLYGKLRPYFRKVDRPNYDGYCSPEIWTLKPLDGVSPEFLESVISSPEFTDFAMQGSGGSRMPRAEWSHVCDFVVKVPPAGDMERISSESRILWESRWKLTEEAQELTVARDALLPLLLSGKITSNSAAKLLEDVAK